MKPKEKMEYWRDICKDWSACGQSQKEFCLHRKISISGFRYWRRQLAEDAPNVHEHNGIQAVEVGLIPTPPWPALLLEIGFQGIKLSVAGSQATVTITGQINLDRLGRIMVACGIEKKGSAEHAQA